MKKIIALLLALTIAVSMLACAGQPAGEAAPAPEAAPAGEAAPAPEAAPNEEVELPAYKVGVILYDLSNLWAKNIMGGLEALGQGLNVTFEYAIGGTDPEATVTAVQNFGAAGCDGILTLHPGAVMGKLVEICAENEMFIVSSNDPANASADYAEFSANPWFAGEVWEDDYQIAYEIASDMIAKGAKTFALTGFPEGLSAQMDKRLQGARAAIADGGAEIVTEGLSFNKAEAAENIISQFPDVNAIFSSVETMSTAYQPLINAGLGDKIMLNCYDPVDGLLEAMQEGVVNYAIDGTMADSMIAFVLLYNAMSGNKMVQDDGSAASIQMQYVVCKSAEDFQTVLDYVSGENPPYTLAELSPFLTALDPAASFNALSEYAGAFGIEDVLARHGA